MIKIILIAGIVLIGWLAFREKASASTLAVRRLAGLGILAGGVVLIVWPDITSWLARLVGVGRGTDLLFYGCVLAFMFASLAQSQRIHRLEQRVVTLTRELALRDVSEAATSSTEDHSDRG